jgi:hypothetical protein
MDEIKDINVCNTYGSLRVKSSNGKFYWSIEDYSGDHWLEISENLYNEIIKWDENERK